MLRINPNTPIEHIRNSIGRSPRERKRESESRRRRLEKVARWVSGKDVRVFWQDEGARCEVAKHSRHDLSIYLPTSEQEQPMSDLEPSIWDFVFQKAELVHELGHVLYTDFDAMEEYSEKIDDLHAKELFHNLFNINEDGAIERQLAASFNVGRDLELKNANLLTDVDPGKSPGGSHSLSEWPREHDVAHAIGSILMDWSKYDTGRAEKLLDPSNEDYVFSEEEKREVTIDLLPLLQDMSHDIVTEPSGRERVRITYEYFQKIREVLEDEDEITEHPLQKLLDEFPGEDMDAMMAAMIASGEPVDAEALDPESDVEVILKGSPAPVDGEEEGVEAQYGAQVNADDEDENEVEEANKWQTAVELANGKLQYQSSGRVDAGTWDSAQQYGKKYKKELKRALQQERESKTAYAQRAGRPDPQSLWQLGYGNTRVFSNEREPEEKDYSVVLLLDRSGSMGGDIRMEWIVDEAEATVTGLAWALEELGVNTAILSVGGKVALEKPFGVSVENRKNVLCRGESDGSTPLKEALKIADERLSQMEGKSLVFSVTDGFPDSEPSYRDYLEKVTFPVVGVYFGPDLPDDAEEAGRLYHRFGTADKEGLSHEIESLIKKMVV